MLRIVIRVGGSVCVAGGIGGTIGPRNDAARPCPNPPSSGEPVCGVPIASVCTIARPSRSKTSTVSPGFPVIVIDAPKTLGWLIPLTNEGGNACGPPLVAAPRLLKLSLVRAVVAVGKATNSRTGTGGSVTCSTGMKYANRAVACVCPGRIVSANM